MFGIEQYKPRPNQTDSSTSSFKSSTPQNIIFASHSCTVCSVRRADDHRALPRAARKLERIHLPLAISAEAKVVEIRLIALHETLLVLELALPMPAQLLLLPLLATAALLLRLLLALGVVLLDRSLSVQFQSQVTAHHADRRSFLAIGLLTSDAILLRQSPNIRRREFHLRVVPRPGEHHGLHLGVARRQLHPKARKLHQAAVHEHEAARARHRSGPRAARLRRRHLLRQLLVARR